MTTNDTWTCNLCLLSVLPFNLNSDTLSSAVDNITMDSNVCKSFLSEDLLRKHMLPNALVIPSEHLLNNQDIDPDINFYNTISKGACCKSCYIDADEFNNFFKPADKHSANVIQINCRSITKNFTALKTFLSTLPISPTVIAVSKTWLNISTEDTVNLLGYNYYSISRSGKRGGGVGIYLHKNFNCSLITEWSVLKDSTECVFIEVFSVKGPNVIVGSVYRPSGSNVADFNYEFASLLSAIKRGKRKLTIIAGDYNLDLLSLTVMKLLVNFLIVFCHILSSL